MELSNGFWAMFTNWLQLDIITHLDNFISELEPIVIQEQWDQFVQIKDRAGGRIRQVYYNEKLLCRIFSGDFISQVVSYMVGLMTQGSLYTTYSIIMM